MFDWFKKYRRRRILRRQIPDDWIEILNRNVAPFSKLNLSHREKLIECVKIMVAERNFEGCNGLTITGEIQVTIAGQAALLLMGTENYYFDTVSAILVFPDVIAREVTHDDQGRNIHGFVETRAGEAYQTGQVVLSWPDVQAGGSRQDGYNLVIHEFAHHLDSLDGEMGGFIPFDDSRDAQRWEQISTREFEQLVEAKQNRYKTLFSYYGATNRAEFFAVASEAFFEKPKRFRAEHSQLYELLKRFYKTDPLDWA